jgi:hypothetical protein
MLQEQQIVDLGSFGLQINASGVLDLDSFSVFKRRPEGFTIIRFHFRQQRTRNY